MFLMHFLVISLAFFAQSLFILISLLSDIAMFFDDPFLRFDLLSCSFFGTILFNEDKIRLGYLYYFVLTDFICILLFF